MSDRFEHEDQARRDRARAHVARMRDRRAESRVVWRHRSRDERASLADRLEAHRTRSETVEQETGESLSALGRSLERLGERQSQQLQELRREFEARLRELTERVERSLSLLDARKTDRELLARLLGELAKGLAGDAAARTAPGPRAERGADTRR